MVEKSQPYRILHFSDLHLDTPFLSDGLPAETNTWRRAGLRSALTRILNLARERQVDAVTIGGDLFEQEYALPETAAFLEQEFRRMAPIRVIIAPGVHDPYTNESFYATTTWPENVDIFYQPRLTTLQLSPDVIIWGAAYPAPRQTNLFKNVKIPADGTHILLLHGTMDPGKHHETGLYDTSTAMTAGFRLALLGSEHTGQGEPEQQPQWIYSGSPEPFNANEAEGRHTAVLVEINRETVHFEWINLQSIHYQSFDIDVSPIASQEELMNLIEQRINAVSQTKKSKNVQAGNTIFTAQLTGTPAFSIDLPSLRSGLSSGARLRVEARFQMARNLEALAQENTVRGLLVRRMQQRIAGATDPAERRQLSTALALALDAMEGKPVNLYETH